MSFGPDEENPDRRLSDRELDDLATAVAERSIREATDEVLDGTEFRSDVLGDLFDVRYDVWQVLVAEHITGRCLDLYAGYGRRSMGLAERADSVYAVDPSLAKLRITAGRNDYASSNRVVPVHTTADRLPFRDGSFDTVVADFTGKSDVRSKLVGLREQLAEDGSLLFLADGWPRKTGLTGLAGVDEGRSTPRGELLPGTAAGYRSLARRVGFDDVSVYALFPTASWPLYAFDIECDRAVRTVFESLSTYHGLAGSLIEKIMSGLNGNRILKHCYPSYVVACTNDPKPPAFGFSNPLVIPGRTRSVVLDVGKNGVEEIWKIPNRRAHGPFTDAENHITSALRSSDEAIASTIPEGRVVDSPFGSVRTEQPVEGRPLDEDLDGGVESFERVLRTGFEWLIEFQQAFRGETVVRSPADAREDLRFEPAGLEPFEIDEPVPTFTTPVHGDFMPSNIYHRDGTVTSVIDWEYGASAAAPIIDAGFLLLDTAGWVIDDFRELVRTILCGQNEYADRARACVREYCDAVGLPYRAFELYLPTAYLHRISRDWRLDAVSTYSTRMERRVQRVQILFDAIDRMNVS